MTPGTYSVRFLLLCLAGGAALAGPAGISGLCASPRSEDARRLAAEIVVMHADAKKLTSATVSVPHQDGLRTRLRGGLALVPLLVRAARRAVPDWPVLDRDRFARLPKALARGDELGLLSGLSWLKQNYPFDVTGLLPVDKSPAAMKRAVEIHESYCGGCHDEPYMDVPRPAWSLYDLGKTAPLPEIAARLVIGVRGENMTAMDNPLRDSEMSALIGYYTAPGSKKQ